MKLLIVESHPYERSFCRALADAAEGAAASGGGDVARRNLYELDFNPLLTGQELARKFSLDPAVQSFTNDLKAADHVVFVHPDWWSGPPAMLKGWIERVFRPGVAYDWVGEQFAEKTHKTLLDEKDVTVFVTTDRPKDDPPKAIELFWSDVCSYSGMRLLSFRFFPALRESSFRTRRTWIKEVEAELRGIVGSQAAPGTEEK